MIKNYVFKKKNKKKIIKLKKNTINLLYVGGFQKNRNLELMLKNLSMFNMKIKWNLYMYGYGECKNKLKNLVKKLNLNDRVFFKYETSNKLLSHIKNYDLGIIPYSANSLNNKYSLPNKFFEYISAGIPIISNNLIEIKKYAYMRSLILLNVNNIKILEKKIFFLSKNNKFNCNLLKKKALKYTGIYDWHKSYTDYISNQIKINL